MCLFFILLVYLFSFDLLRIIIRLFRAPQTSYKDVFITFFCLFRRTTHLTFTKQNGVLTFSLARAKTDTCRHGSRGGYHVIHRRFLPIADNIPFRLIICPILFLFKIIFKHFPSSFTEVRKHTYLLVLTTYIIFPIFHYYQFIPTNFLSYLNPEQWVFNICKVVAIKLQQTNTQLSILKYTCIYIFPFL